MFGLALITLPYIAHFVRKSTRTNSLDPCDRPCYPVNGDCLLIDVHVHSPAFLLSGIIEAQIWRSSHPNEGYKDKAQRAG